jgi:prefoldin subunit 5
MTTRAGEQFDEWESSPFRDGYRGLDDLAAEEFSGIVQAGTAKLCMLSGTVVGILDGDIDDYEGASGTAYAAPSPALPLLALMQERNDEVRAKYYSEDTPLSEVDGTLSDGGFTGFIELSENVLSGDYYAVYHRGRSMAVAWVGNNGQLLTDDEAFERADDEVGIFQVRPAAIEPVDIPDVETDDGSDGTDVGGPTEAASERDRATSEAVEETEGQADAGAADARPADASADEGSADSTPAETAASEPSDSEPDASRTEAATESDETEDRSGTTTSDRNDRATEQSTEGSSSGRTESDRVPDRRTETDRTETNRTDRTDRARREESTEARAPAETGDAPTTDARTTDTQSDAARETTAGGATEPDQLATHSIPSLDPSRTTAQGPDEATAAASGVPDDARARDSPEPTGSAEAGRSAASSNERPGEATAGRAESTGGRKDGRSPANESPSNARAEQPRQAGSPDEPRKADTQRTAEPGAERSSARGRDLEAELAEREAEIEDLEADLAAAESEQEDLRADLERVRTERDDLQSRIDALESERDALDSEVGELEGEVERLESQIDEIEAEFGGAVGADERLSPGKALDQTNLFVRYGSKGKATLETARAGEASRQEVGENLGLEYHTQFDSDNASVGGRPFDEFLRETMQYQFVTWVINDLLYEIRDTGKVSALQDLYDGIPQIDRAELNGTVSTEYTEDGQERRSQESFDVVMRDRMGNALLTANMNDSRQAASESMMSALVTASSHVGESTETLGASLLVTSSFFEPEALETAAEATSGGLLSRDKRESFVKLSRKQGYHLCLVEAREEKFHLAVPEL